MCSKYEVRWNVMNGDAREILRKTGYGMSEKVILEVACMDWENQLKLQNLGPSQIQVTQCLLSSMEINVVRSLTLCIIF
jgi:hypothetical protein